MKKNILILCFLTFILIGFGQSNYSSWRQMENDPDLLKTMPELYNEFFSSKDMDTLPSEVKAYHRFLRYWYSRVGLDANDKFSYEPYLQTLKNNMTNPICNGNDPANWELMGPSIHPDQQQGLFTEVLYDPTYPEKILASSNHGGLWKFNPTTNKWYSVTDDLRFPGVSANDLLRNPFDSDMIFAATGNGLWKTEYGLGILVSTDRGESWAVMQSFINHVNNEFPRLVRIVPDPSDNNPNNGLSIYAAGPKHIYYTSNTGQTWTTIGPDLNLPNGEEIYDMEVTSSGKILVGTTFDWSFSAHAYILNNGQWDEILPETSYSAKRVKITTPDGNLIYAIKDRGIYDAVEEEYDDMKRSLYKSTNGGVSWTLLDDEWGGVSGKCEIEYSSESNLLYHGVGTAVGIHNATTGNLIKTISNNYETMHADNRDIHICGIEHGIEKVLLANDGGITLLNTITNSVQNSYTENLNGDYLPCNNAIGLAVSNSNDKSWFTGCVHQGTFYFNDKTINTNFKGDGEDGVYHPSNSKIYYYNANGTIKKVGEQTNVHSSSNYNEESGSYINMRMILNPNNPDILYFGLIGRLGIYDDATETTTYSETVTSSKSILAQVGAIAVSKNDDIYIADYKRRLGSETGKLLTSTDNGISWDENSTGLVYKKVNGQWVSQGALHNVLYWKSIEAIACNPDNNNELWIGIGGINTDSELRVLHSTNGGSSWYDYSEGLNPLPITTFKYHYPTETLFVGTDGGVFYRHPFNDINGEWSCFSDGLPVAAVTDMEINSCSNQLYVSLQGRSVFATPIPFSIVNTTSNSYEGDVIVSSDQIWNNQRLFDGNITVSPGKSLTINADCYFSENNSIVVHPGAELIMNAKLTTHTCGGPWSGIFVAGNSDLAAHPDNQGIVYLNSGAIIENANVGIATYILDTQGNEIVNSYGGIIRADGAKFINNRIGCEIKLYNPIAAPIHWQTEIENSEFYIDGSYYALFSNYTETPIGIQIINNNRIKIHNNRFETGHLIKENWTWYPIGIQKFNSAAIISSNFFSDLSYGVFSRDYYPSSFVDMISDNIFSNNFYGLYEDGVIGSQFINNSIRNATIMHDESNVQPIIGVYKNACSNFILEENMFHGNFTLDEQVNIGLLINEGGSNDQVIYKNDFEGYDYAVIAQGNNRNTTGSAGLSFKCNTFLIERKDISVSAQLGDLNPGIATSQGSAASGTESAAGNQFNNMTYREAHFWNLSLPNTTATYYHHTSTPNNYNRLIPGYIDPSLINGVVVAENSSSLWSEVNSCPSHLLGIGKEEKLASAEAGMTSTETSLNTLVDAGDTPEMQQEVMSEESSEAYELRNELLNSSPYLSNEVLETATQKQEVLTNPLIRDVLVANPHSAKDEEVLTMIDSRDMPGYMKEQIINGQAIISAKEQMEAQLHQQRMDYNNTLSLIIAEYLDAEHENYSIDNAKLLLANAKNIDARYQLAGLYFDEGNTQALASTLNSISNDFDLSQSQSQELSDMSNYFSIVNQLKADGRQANDLNNAEINELNSIYENSDNKAAIYARNLLLQAQAIEYEAPVILPDMDNKSTLITTQAKVSSAQQDPVFIQVYPNPAKDYIIFEYDIISEFDQAQVIIYHGAKGEQIKQIGLTTSQNSITIDVKDLSPGAYIASIQVDGKTLKSIKFTIAK